MNTALLIFALFAGSVLSFIVVTHFRIMRIVNAVEKTVEIAEREELARIKHREDKIQRKEEEKKERNLRSATGVIWEIQKLLLAEGLDLRVENINTKEDSQGYFIFRGGVEGKKYWLKIHILPVGSAAQIFAERFGASLTTKSSKFLFPQEKEIIGKTIAHWEHE